MKKDIDIMLVQAEMKPLMRYADRSTLPVHSVSLQAEMEPLMRYADKNTLPVHGVSLQAEMKPLMRYADRSTLPVHSVSLQAEMKPVQAEIEPLMRYADRSTLSVHGVSLQAEMKPLMRYADHSTLPVRILPSKVEESLEHSTPLMTHYDTERIGYPQSLFAQNLIRFALLFALLFSAGTAFGQLSVSPLDGTVDYSYLISHFTVDGYGVSVQLNYCGNTSLTAFGDYSCPDSVGWAGHQLKQTQPLWVVGVNNFAVQVLSDKYYFKNPPLYDNYELADITKGLDFLWMVDGYDFCNRMDMRVKNDVIKLLQADGSVMELRNSVPDSVGLPGSITGHYFQNAINGRGYGIVELDSVTLWPAAAKAAAASMYPNRYLYVPRVLKYYPGDGLEYIFREYTTPFPQAGLTGSPVFCSPPLELGIYENEKATYPTIFYLEEIRSSNRTLLNFKRSWHNPGDTYPESSQQGRAFLTGFMGHHFTYTYNSMTIEALDRTIAVKFKNKTCRIMPGLLESPAVNHDRDLDPSEWMNEDFEIVNRDQLGARYGMVTEIRDTANHHITFDYEHYNRIYKGFGYVNNDTFALFRLSKVTAPTGLKDTLEYYSGSGNVVASELSNPAASVLNLNVQNVIHKVKEYDKSGQQLTEQEYSIDTSPADYDREVTLSITDKITNRSSTAYYYYHFYELPVYHDPSCWFIQPKVSFPALEKSVSVVGDVTNIVTTAYSSQAGGSRYLWGPVSSCAQTKQGSSDTLTTSRLAHEYTFETIYDFGGNDSLTALFGQGIHRRTTYAINPANASDTLFKNIAEYLHLPLLKRHVTRIDSVWNESATRHINDSLLKAGQQKMALVFDTTHITDSLIIVPPIQGLVQKALIISGRTGDTLSGRINIYETFFDSSSSPTHPPRGMLVTDTIIGTGGNRSSGGMLEYSGGWYHNTLRSAITSQGSKTSLFSSYQDAPFLHGSLPSGTKVKNDNSTASQTLYHLNGFSETILAREGYVRRYDPSGARIVSDTLANYTELASNNRGIGAVDANGFYAAAEYDNNGRVKTVWKPFDFPSSSSCTGPGVVKLNTFATAIYIRPDTVDCDSGIVRSGPRTQVGIQPDYLGAEYRPGTPDSCLPYPINPRGTVRSFTSTMKEATIVYTASGSDDLHTASSVSAAELVLTPTVVNAPQCATAQVTLRELGYSKLYTFDCPQLDGASMATIESNRKIRVDLMPVIHDLQSMVSNAELHIDIKMASAGRMEFAAYAEDAQPYISLVGSMSTCPGNDFTYRFTYDDASLSQTVFAKIDDGNHTTSPAWSATMSGYDGRYTGARSYFRSDGAALQSHLLIGNPSSPSRIDTVLFSLDGYGGATRVTDPLGRMVQMSYDGSKWKDTLMHTDSSIVTSQRIMNTQDYFDIDSADQYFYGICSQIVSTDERGRHNASYEDVFGRVRRTVQDTDSVKLTTRYEYDYRGRLKYVVNPAGDTTKYFYDAFGRLKYSLQSDVGLQSYAYDHRDRVRFSQTQGQADSSLVSFYEYDDFGRQIIAGEAKLDTMTSIDLPGGDTAMGRLTDKLNPNVLHNDLSDPVTVNRTLWQSVSDAGSIPSLPSNVIGTWCLPTAAAETTEETDPVAPYLVRPAKYYEALALPECSDESFEDVKTYPEHALTVSNYDQMPAQAGSVWMRFPNKAAWDSLAPKGTVRNLKGREAAVAYRDHGKQAFHYVVSSYDERGRLEALLRYTENIGYEGIYYSYNSAEQILSVTTADPRRQHTTWYSYDENGRVVKVWTKLGDTTTGLGIGNVIRYPTPMSKPTKEDVRYTYDRLGRIDSLVYGPDTVVSVYRYGRRGWLDSMVATKNYSALFRQVLTHNGSGQITGQVSQHSGQSQRSEAYSYDRGDRLVGWLNNSDAPWSYSYDEVGNRTGSNEGTAMSYYYDAVRPNRLDSVVAGTSKTSYLYNADGEVSKREERTSGTLTRSEEFTYMGGLLTGYVKIGQVPATAPCTPAPMTFSSTVRDWRYRYNASGEREQKRLYYSPYGDSCDNTHPWEYYVLGAGDEQLAVWHGRQTVDSFCSIGGRRVVFYPVEYISYCGGASIITRPDGTKEFNLKDHLGSIRSVVKPSAEIVLQRDYKPFGGVFWSNTPERRVGYIGRQKDEESDLHDFGVRKYDPKIGRFLSTDPLMDMQPELTPYHYSANDPINGSDGSGLLTLSLAIREDPTPGPGHSSDDGGGGTGDGGATTPGGDQPKDDGGGGGGESGGGDDGGGDGGGGWDFGPIGHVFSYGWGTETGNYGESLGGGGSTMVPYAGFTGSNNELRTIPGLSNSVGKQVQNTLNFMRGFAHAITNNTFGTSFDDGGDQSYYAGRLAGDIASLIEGAQKVYAGRILIGLGLSAEGIAGVLEGTIIGAPAGGLISLEGLGSIAVGTALVLQGSAISARATIAMAHDLNLVNMYSQSSGDGSGNANIDIRPDVQLNGGRSGENVKNLTGPANSAVKGSNGRVFVTDSQGKVVLDITNQRVKPVIPGKGFGAKRPPTSGEIELIEKVWGGN